MGESAGSRWTRLYYLVKPLLPRRLRLVLRRKWTARIRESAGHVWPINERAGEYPSRWPGWPDGKKFALVLTHDVESGEGQRKARLLAELEMRAGFRSSFNFIPEGSYRVSPELRAWLAGKGFEVGVHDLHHNGRLYRSRDLFKTKARKINRYLKEWNACGFRSGFMLRQLDWLHDLDVSYDASTFDTDPFEPQPDGCGTIFPFFVSDRSCAGSGYVELPYTLPQDSTLFLLLGESSPEIWLRKLDWVVARGGLALVNIHPDYVDFEGSSSGDFHYPSSHITEFLAYVKDRYHGQFWNPLAKELAGWYREKHFEEGRLIDKPLFPGGNLASP